MNDVAVIYSMLLSRGYQEELFSDLHGTKRDDRNNNRAFCPFCQAGEHSGRGHFSYSLQEALWRCFSCDSKGDWIRYLEQRRGLSFLEALKLLAQRAGVEMAGYDQAKHETAVKTASILEAARKLFRATLFHPEGEEVYDYLLERGYRLDDLHNMEDLGAMLPRDRLQAELEKQGYSLKEIQDAGLLTKGYGDIYKLSILWRDQAGRPIGVAGRALLSKEELKARDLPKYKYSYGLEKDQGLIGFREARGKPVIALVEGVLDALYINAKDAAHNLATVAVGGTSLSFEQLKALEVTGTQQIFIALDSDTEGQKATERLLRTIRASSITPFVVSLPAPYKDPDELVRKQGIDAFIEACNQAQEWSRWLPSYLLSKHNLETATGLDMALRETLEAYAGIEDGLYRRSFMETLEQRTGFSKEELEARASQATEQASRKQAEAKLQSLSRTVLQKVSEHDVIGAELEIEQTLRGLRQSRGVLAPEPYLIEDVLRDLQAGSEGLRTGWTSLDSLLKVPSGALTIAAGRPGHGKTTFQLNLLLNMLEAYPHLPFYFYSYEEAKSKLALKLIMCMAGQTLHSEQNQEAYLSYFKYKRASEPNEAIEHAVGRFDAYTKEGRLLLFDKRLYAHELASMIGRTASMGKVGAVFVDYIQKIPLERPHTMPYMNIKEVSALLLEQAVAQGIPIIVGAQLGRAQGTSSKVRLDNLREAGDLEQDAALVLGLYNQSVDHIEEAGEPVKGPTVELEVSVLKQRGGIVGRKTGLSFERPTLRITDRKLGSSLY